MRQMLTISDFLKLRKNLGIIWNMFKRFPPIFYRNKKPSFAMLQNIIFIKGWLYCCQGTFRLASSMPVPLGTETGLIIIVRPALFFLPKGA